MGKALSQSRVLLSICIPTYNRSKHLKITLDSILCQERFYNYNDIEIVISDNCSSDDTEKVVEEYIVIWGDRIKYHKNATNIRDANFEKALSLGCGEYLKLNNDTLSHLGNSMELITGLILQNLDDRRHLFFDNGTTIGRGEFTECSGIDSFVSKTSFWMTWIGCFGIWRNDFNKLENFSACADLQLTQVDVWLTLVSQKEKVLIVKSKYATVQEVEGKGGYNIIEVFVRNYFYLLNKYSNGRGVKKRTIFYEKFKLMKRFLLPWIVKILIESKYSFSLRNGIGVMVKEYRFHPGLLFFFMAFPFWYVYGFLKMHIKQFVIR